MSARSRSRARPDAATRSLFDDIAPATSAPPESPPRDDAQDTGAPLVGARHADAKEIAAEDDPAHGALAKRPEHWLARTFAEALARWARAEGAPAASIALVERAGYAVSMATAAGHACIDARTLQLPDDPANMREALLASRVVGTGSNDGALPLVLDREHRLYLARYFDDERRIAQRVVRSARHVLDAEDEQRIADRLDALFAGNDTLPAGEADWQKLAAGLAVLNRLTVISGGPGTGKTTTVVNLLACIVEIEPDCRIALAAPTGKAAARMQEAVRERAMHLPPSVRERLPAESFTIHRLLGVDAKGEFLHHARHPLPYDLVVIDEASMLDLALAANLFDAISERARIVLLGDKDQLAAVESGAVFSELCADPAMSTDAIARLSRVCRVPTEAIVPPSTGVVTPLRDRVIWFTRNYRFAPGSGIGRLAADINAGATDAVLEWLASGHDASVSWIDDATPTLAPESLDHLRHGYAAYAEALRRDAGDADRIFAAFERFRVLCAERASMRGVRALNEALAKHCRAAIEGSPVAGSRSPWHVGRPVMIARNDYVLKLYNGDVGIALPDAEGRLLVHFRDREGAFRAVAPMRLPEHDTAFATTVHKAQGSEFDEITLVLPATASAVLTRELVYTAVTRARRKVTLITGVDVLAAAIGTPTVRHSGLIARLAEAGGPAR